MKGLVKFGQTGLRTRLALLLVLVFVPIVAIVGNSQYKIRQHVHERAIEDAGHVARLVSQFRHEIVASARHMLESLPSDLGLEECSDDLARRLRVHGELAYLGLADGGGRVLCSAPETPSDVSLGDRAYFREAVATCRGTISPVLNGRINLMPVVVLAQPRCEAGKVERMLIASVSLTRFETLLRGAPLPEETEILVADANSGEVTLHFHGAVSPPHAAVYAQPASLFQMNGRRMSHIIEDGKLLIAVREQEPHHALSDTVVLFRIPLANLHGGFDRLALLQLVALGVVLFVSAALAWLGTSVTVIRPLNRLLGGITSLRNGEPPRHDAYPSGEFGIVFEAFDGMAARIQDQRAQILALNRLYEVLSRTNAAIVRLDTEEELWEETCRILVDVGGLRAVWVYRASGDGSQLHLTAWRGGQDEITHELPLHAGWHTLPTLHNALEGPIDSALMQPATRLGCRSAATFPLHTDGALVGVLCLAADQADAFGEKELNLLRELSGDIAFFISTHTHRERLEALSRRDALTGLPNQAAFRERVAERLLEDENENALLLFVVRVESYYTIDSFYGRHTGDALLREIARRLQAECPDDMVGRLGTGVFGLLSRADRHDPEQPATALLEAIDRAIPGRLILDGAEVFANARIGIALASAGVTSADELMRHAKTALRDTSLPTTTNTYRFFTPAMNRAVARRFSLETALRTALERDEFHLHYQPQIELRGGNVIGMEALLRWDNSELGVITPSEFIPVAEESGLIGPIGEWVLETACRQIRAWRDDGLRPGTIAVNVSAHQFEGGQVVAQVEALLERYQLQPEELELELTESALMGDPDGMIATIKSLDERGIQLALDDFGTGYSSLAYLKQFAFGKLKIDRSFVTDITLNPNGAAIARTIIAMARALRMRTIAEGVEQESELQYLRRIGCDEMQGFFFSRPLSAEAMGDLLRGGHKLEVACIDEAQARNTLLILDDEPNIVRALRRTLHREGYRVLAATSSAEAFEMLATEAVGVVICDQRMPDISGSEFLNRIRELYPETVRVLLTGYTQIDTVLDAVNRGRIFRFITKPWNDGELREHLRDAFAYYDALASREKPPRLLG